MKQLKIINEQNQLGTDLETYGQAMTIKAKYIKIVLCIICLITFGTNWLIPIIINKIKDIKIRYNNY